MIAIRERLLAQADTLETVGDDVLASQCLERAGIVGYRLAEYENALAIWVRGLEVARRSGDNKRIAALLNAQAIGVSITGDNEGAVKLQLELITIRQEIGDVRGEGNSWHNLAFSYFALFQYPEGIDAISSALRLHREAENAFGMAGSMSTLANALFEVGQRQDALAMADSAVARARPLNNPSLLGSALQGRGRQLHHAGRYEDALADYEEAHTILDEGGVARVVALNDINWANALVSLDRCDEARTVIDEAMQILEPIGTAPELVWGDCVRSRILARCGDGDTARAALLATIGDLEAIRDSIPDQLTRADAFRMAGGAYVDLAMLELDEEKPDEAWVAIETSSARLFREDLGIDVHSTLVQLQARLAELNAIAIQFGHSTVDRNAVCVVTPDGIVVHPVVIGEGFRMDVTAALRLMSSGAGDDECRPVLERIANVVLAPVADALAAKGERLIVLPGGLAGFPVDALPMPGSQGGTIGDRFAITYAPSATAFLHLQEREASNQQVIVFADPETDAVGDEDTQLAMRTARMTLAPLPEARAEGKTVSKSGTLLVGADATRDAFLVHATDAGVVHVAAHALVDATHPDHSGVVLAGENGGDMLTVGELQGLQLGADLVSLSGCSTAGGYIATGDGAFGLTRAFLLAGARSVVSSWWDVEDAAARRFMELFYEALRNDVPRDIALQQARQQMAKEGFSHRDRTAFALTGATADSVPALTRASAFPLSGVGSGAIVVIIIVLIAATRRRRSRA